MNTRVIGLSRKSAYVVRKKRARQWFFAKLSSNASCLRCSSLIGIVGCFASIVQYLVDIAECFATPTQVWHEWLLWDIPLYLSIATRCFGDLCIFLNVIQCRPSTSRFDVNTIMPVNNEYANRLSITYRQRMWADRCRWMRQRRQHMRKTFVRTEMLWDSRRRTRWYRWVMWPLSIQPHR